MKIVSVVTTALILTGCASGFSEIVPADKTSKRIFTYDYVVEGASKDVLWTRARDYFAKSFGDSRSVLRVQDKESSTLIGKGAESWNLLSNICASEYDLQFMSKEGRARLQLEIIEGVPSYSSCKGWPWPSQSGYETIVSSFGALSSGLETALRSNSSFSDF